ncbi:MAG: hypothetical protein AB1815_05185 [Bacillota bacterium]
MAKNKPVINQVGNDSAFYKSKRQTIADFNSKINLMENINAISIHHAILPYIEVTCQYDKDTIPY